MVRFRQINRFIQMIKRGHLSLLLKEIKRRFYSDSRAIGLRRDLYVPFEAPEAAVQIEVRAININDYTSLLDTENLSLSDAEFYDRMSRRDMVNSGLSECFVAVTSQDEPCYMQWLMGSDQNDKIQKYFSGLFPLLRRDEALLEGAYTVEKHRGKGIMAGAMAKIAEKASENGVRWVITFVADDNIPSLKGCKRANFVPYLVRYESWRLFQRRLSMICPADISTFQNEADRSSNHSPANAGIQQ
jgi:hypothetical protein